jgi:outer membrane protein TolC
VYSFSEIAEIALQNNFELKISYKDIDLSQLDIRSNRSFILPSLSSGLTAFQINEERANAMINSPERSLSFDLMLTQVIYSEEALAAIKISQYLKNAQEYQTEADVLNLLLDTYGAYLNVLSAKTNLDIQRRNLENTKTNLELARIRVDVGAANKADLFRWESEVANATQTLIEAQASLFTVKLQLNNLLANSLERDFEVKDIGLEDELFRSFRESPISNLITTPDDLRLVSDFLVQESLDQNPNKMQILENIKASERQLQLNKRLLYVPTISLQAQASEILARGGEGTEEPDPGTPSFGTGLQDNTWSVGATLSYPLFTGLSRRIERQKSLVQLEQLEFSNSNLDQALELSIRANTISLLSATTNLGYSKQSAESANKNFLLVQNNYKEGAVNITQVIDAQEAALNANLQAAISVYEYIFANLQLEYSIGLFSMFLTEEQLADFNNRFLEFISKN